MLRATMLGLKSPIAILAVLAVAVSQGIANGGRAMVQDASGPFGSEHLVGGDSKKRYFLLPPALGLEKEHDLVLVLPGGGLPMETVVSFMQRVQERSCRTAVFAVLVPPRWDPKKSTKPIWPTRADVSASGEKPFSSVEFVRETLKDIEKKKLFKTKDVFLFGWSESGPTVYVASLEKKRTPYDGALILTSTFDADQVHLKHAKGRRFCLQQSTKGNPPALRHAREAKALLESHGAVVKLDTYNGSSTFSMPGTYVRLQRGFAWLRSED